MKALAVILIFVAAGLAWLLRTELAANSQLRGESAQLAAQLADKTRLESLQLQEKCAEQAKKVFRTLGYKELKDTQQSPNTDTYQSHYNAKLGKCFMAIERVDMTTTPGKQFINRMLLDAFEQREYAEYTWISRNDKKDWEVPPMICKLIESSSSEQVCKTEGEYKAFVAKYVE